MPFSFFPRTVCKTKSKISGEIIAKEQFGKHILHVDNLIQSGGIVKGIWKKAFRKIPKKLFVSNCLLLGLGGGTVVQLIKARWPEAKITGIELDSEIVKIGKKFFGLGEIDNLEIINNDAIEWVNSCQDRKFDLILVDLYVGGKLPKGAEDKAFLKNLQKLLSQKGVIIFNWLKNKDEKRFIETLKRNFSNFNRVDLATNIFLLVK